MNADVLPTQSSSMTLRPDRWDMRRSWVAVPILGVVVGLAAAHNRGYSAYAPWALVAAVLLPIAVGARMGPWLRLASKGWAPALLLAAGLLAGPALMLAGFIHFRLGAMVLHPSWVEALAFVGARWAGALPLALAEEFLFRGWLQQEALRGVRYPIPMGAAAFALAHALAVGHVLFFPGWLLGGLVLGWTVRRSGGALWPAVALHAAMNAALAWFGLLASMNLPMLAL